MPTPASAADNTHSMPTASAQTHAQPKLGLFSTAAFYQRGSIWPTFACLTLALYAAVWISPWTAALRYWVSPQAAMAQFYQADLDSEHPMDPLILAGNDALPLALNDLTHPDQAHRQQILTLLGEAGYKDAEPALTRVVHNFDEFPALRAEALTSLHRINRPEALLLARQYQSHPTLLGKTASQFFNGSWSPAPKRSYWRALLSLRE